MSPTMQEILLPKFHQYLQAHYPERVLALQETQGLMSYLTTTVQSVELLAEELVHRNVPPGEIEHQCWALLLETLPPSRFDYLSEIVESEFAEQYARLEQQGMLTMELVNLITFCDPVFEGLGPDEEDRYLRYAIMGTVHEYFEREKTRAI